jgi:predicted DNA-binding transcriptional regulator YafY
MSLVDTIRQAALNRNILKIVYREKDGTSEGWRYLEFYSFSHDHGEDGFFAWDLGKNGIRRFSFNRVDDIQIMDQRYNPRYRVEI